MHYVLVYLGFPLSAEEKQKERENFKQMEQEMDKKRTIWRRLKCKFLWVYDVKLSPSLIESSSVPPVVLALCVPPLHIVCQRLTEWRERESEADAERMGGGRWCCKESKTMWLTQWGIGRKETCVCLYVCASLSCRWRVIRLKPHTLLAVVMVTPWQRPGVLPGSGTTLLMRKGLFCVRFSSPSLFSVLICFALSCPHRFLFVLRGVFVWNVTSGCDNEVPPSAPAILVQIAALR